MNVIPWTEKYRPESSHQVCGNVLEFEKVLSLGAQKKNLLLCGPSGTGKSSAVRVLLKNVPKESKLILDAKARANGTTQQLIRKLTNFTMKKTETKERFILVDEVDSIRIIDQKIFIRPLTKNIGDNSDKQIIYIFICNRLERVSEFIVRNCEVIMYNPLEFDMTITYLRDICNNENIVYDEYSLKTIFIHVGSDLRKMVSTMQYLYMMTGKVCSSDFKTIDPISELDYTTFFDSLMKNNNTKHIIDLLYGKAYSVNALSELMMMYHEEKNMMTHTYIKILGQLCHDSHTTDDTWFLLYRMIIESPIRKEYMKHLMK